MKTHTIELTEHEEQFLKDLIGSGKFPNVDTAIEAGLTMLEAKLERDEHKITNQP